MLKLEMVKSILLWLHIGCETKDDRADFELKKKSALKCFLSNLNKCHRHLHSNEFDILQLNQKYK